MLSSLEQNRWLRVARAALSNRKSRRARRIRVSALTVALSFVLAGWTLDWHVQSSDGPPEQTAGVPVAMADLEAELGESVHLPMEVNERVEFWMTRYLNNPTAFQETLSKAGLYSEMIREKLHERGMPQELLYLAAIESEFSTGARSRVAATGMWQFMGPTARAYGLRVDAYVDERRDPIRATEAALDYLNALYDRYDSWYLAAAAYNAGPTRVSRALRRHADGRVGNEALYWEIVDHLPAETQEFVPKLLAATTLARNPAKYGLEFDLVASYEFDLVWVPGGTEVREVAGALGLAEERLRALNPHLTRGVTPPDAAFGLRVPVGMAPRAVASLSPRAQKVRRADD